MSQKILQINFKYSGSAAKLGADFAPAAQPIADTPGLRWKIWIVNEETRDSGGIYLFDDEASVQAYLSGPIVASVGAHPALSDISVKIFGVVEEPSLVTRAPIRDGVRV